MRIFKKTDIILLFAVVLLSLAAAVALRTFLPQGKTVTIYKNNEKIGSYSLFEDKKIILDGNTVIIKNGLVKMQSGDCPLKICESHAAVHKKGETIVCLPHKVIVEVG